jgi:hypothetical protein
MYEKMRRPPSILSIIFKIFLINLVILGDKYPHKTPRNTPRIPSNTSIGY